MTRVRSVRLVRRRREIRATLRRWRVEEWMGNFGDCPYYRGAGTCIYGCYDEPVCVTCQPDGGWPKVVEPTWLTS